MKWDWLDVVLVNQQQKQDTQAPALWLLTALYHFLSARNHFLPRDLAGHMPHANEPL